VSKRAVFLDRDGVINHTVFKHGGDRAPYELRDLRLIAGVEEAVRRLRESGYLIVIVTNQPDHKRGWVTRAQIDAVNAEIERILRPDGLEVCFHDAADGCACRKPRPGMLLSAAERLCIDLASSWMIGDRRTDIEAGLRAGCGGTILISQVPDSSGQGATHQAPDLWHAVDWLLRRA
jgi:D-glycero-D-manno-heptose 1,7-bisphosphate phosphatase